MTIIKIERADQGPEDALDLESGSGDGADDVYLDVVDGVEGKPALHLKIPSVHGESSHALYNRCPHVKFSHIRITPDIIEFDVEVRRNWFLYGRNGIFASSSVYLSEM